MLFLFQPHWLAKDRKFAWFVPKKKMRKSSLSVDGAIETLLYKLTSFEDHINQPTIANSLMEYVWERSFISQIQAILLVPMA